MRRQGSSSCRAQETPGGELDTCRGRRGWRRVSISLGHAQVVGEGQKELQVPGRAIAPASYVNGDPQGGSDPRSHVPRSSSQREPRKDSCWSPGEGARAPQDTLHSCKCFLCKRNSYTPVPSSGVHVPLNRPNGICFLVKQHWQLIRHPAEVPGLSTQPVLWEALVRSLPLLFPHLKTRVANGDRLTWLSGKSG